MPLETRKIQDALSVAGLLDSMMVSLRHVTVCYIFEKYMRNNFVVRIVYLTSVHSLWLKKLSSFDLLHKEWGNVSTMTKYCECPVLFKTSSPIDSTMSVAQR